MSILILGRSRATHVATSLLAALALVGPVLAQAPTVLLRQTGTQANMYYGALVVRLQDFDNDGREEFAVASPGPLMRVWTGLSPTNQFTLAGGLSGLLDVDADGHEEIVSYDSNYYDLSATPPQAVGALRIATTSGMPVRSYLGWVGPSWPPDNRLVIRGATGSVGDVDGDGIDDHMAYFSLLSTFYFPIISGRTGGIIRFGSALGMGAAIGDLDDDGFDEVLVGTTGVGYWNGSAWVFPGWVSIENGRTGALMWSKWGDADGDRLGETVVGVDDLDGDGVQDVVASAPGSASGSQGYVRAFSGANGSTIWTATPSSTHDGYGLNMVAGADWTGDGVPDVAATGVFDVPGPFGLVTTRLVDLLDGTNGQFVTRLPYQPAMGWFPPESFGRLHLAGDLDQDGSVELITNSGYRANEPFIGAGTMTIWKLANGNIAYRRYRGASCLGSNGKNLRIVLRQTPRLGHLAEFRLRAALPMTPAVLAFGWSNTQPLAGTSCMTHADPNAFGMPLLTNADGFARFDVTVPSDPALAGLGLCSYWQALDDGANPLGVTTSNACEFVLGW